MTRSFVAGGAGFVGSHLTRTLLRQAADEIVVYDNLVSGSEAHLEDVLGEPRLNLVVADLQDLDRVVHEMAGAEHVYLFAANPDIAAAVDDPGIDFWQGTYLTHNVLEAMRINGVPRITYASGSGVYGDRGVEEVDEDFGPLVPVSTYGASKLACEAMLAAYSHMFGIDAVVFRFANVVGPHQTHGVTYDFVRRLLDDPTQLRILGDGRQSKSYIHVSDVVAAMLTLTDHGWSGFEIFNAGTGDYITVTEIADLVVARLGLARRALRVHGRGARVEGRRSGRALPQREAREARMAMQALIGRGAGRLDRGQHLRGAGHGPAMSTQTTALDTFDTPTQTAPEVSIVVPCLNEELTIGEFVDWCHKGLAAAGVAGEILIVDSSDDRSPIIAAERGARVITVPRKGLGQAYIDAIEHVRGEIVIMGDCDLTYDFRELAGFVQAVRDGNDFVMGTRTRGEIEPGAMPPLHRYFGSPATTMMFNVIYGTRFSDIHCGMRAITLSALKRMELESAGWEYASEMILKARRMGMRTTEVPVRFWKDREGRESHLKRGGWRTPWIAGWNSVRVMCLYAPDFFLLRPGAVLCALGLVLSAALAPGPFTAFGIGFNLHWMLLAMVIATVGYSAVQLAILARVFYDFDKPFTNRVLDAITYNRGVAASGLLILAGLVPNLVLLVRWLSHDFHLPTIQYSSVFGLLLIVLGFQTFGFTLLLHMMGRRSQLRRTS